MIFFTISGAPNTGKTTLINRIALWLTEGIITTDIDGNPLPTFLPDENGRSLDFSIVILLRNRTLIIHTATDDQPSMDELIHKLNLNPDTDIVITSCRDINWERDYFTTHVMPHSEFFLESPLAKITRRNDFETAITWYYDNTQTLHQHILSNTPYNL